MSKAFKCDWCRELFAGYADVGYPWKVVEHPIYIGGKEHLVTVTAKRKDGCAVELCQACSKTFLRGVADFLATRGEFDKRMDKASRWPSREAINYGLDDAEEHWRELSAGERVAVLGRIDYILEHAGYWRAKHLGDWKDIVAERGDDNRNAPSLLRVQGR